MAEPVGVLDGLVARVLAQYPYRFSLPADSEDRAIGFRIRHAAVLREGWSDPAAYPDGLERDQFDDRAVQILGWDGEVAVCTGRLVLPPGPLPTELAAGIRVQPHGAVVDVGRMTVSPDYRSYRAAAFIALLCRLYLEMRQRGFEVACGMMSASTRGLTERLGLRLELLGPELPYWGELRAPVRFTLLANGASLTSRWSGEQ
jgi:hypothetical protein